MGSDEDWAALRLTRLALPVVSKRPRPSLVDPTVRAALLIDLALRGALQDAGTGIEVDTTPTGFEPADRLITAVVEQPDRALAWWVGRASITARDLADHLVEAGVWERHGPLHAYRDLQPRDREADAHRIRHAVNYPTDEPVTIAVAALARFMQLPLEGYGYANADLPARCGQASWLVPDLIAYLDDRRTVLRASAHNAQISQIGDFI